MIADTVNQHDFSRRIILHSGDVLDTWKEKRGRQNRMNNRYDGETNTPEYVRTHKTGNCTRTS